MTIYTPVDRATDLDGLSLMLAQFAVSTYEWHLIVIPGDGSEPTSGNMLSVRWADGRLDLTGSCAFGMDDTMEYVARRIRDGLADGATIEAGGARLAIDGSHPLEDAYRPTEDVLVLRTGGPAPVVMTIVADRARGPAS